MRVVVKIHVALAILLLIAFIACQKAKVTPAPASFTIVHAMTGGNRIVPKLGLDTARRYYVNSASSAVLTKISYGNSLQYSAVAGNIALSVVPITDTTFKIFQGNLPLVSGGIYSFFLSGDTLHADTLLVKDEIPTYNDSTAGIRFVNLSNGGKSLSLNLAGDPGNKQVPSLGYRQITGFLPYDARTIGGSYSFDIRDGASGDSLTTITWNYITYKNTTIVIAGPTDPTNPSSFRIISVKNY
jgi:hypothetical protein